MNENTMNESDLYAYTTVKKAYTLGKVYYFDNKAYRYVRYTEESTVGVVGHTAMFDYTTSNVESEVFTDGDIVLTTDLTDTNFAGVMLATVPVAVDGTIYYCFVQCAGDFGTTNAAGAVTAGLKSEGAISAGAPVGPTAAAGIVSTMADGQEETVIGHAMAAANDTTKFTKVRLRLKFL